MTRKMAQIGGANVVWDAEDDGNAGSTAQPVCGLWGTPPSAIVYPFHSSSGECRLNCAASAQGSPPLPKYDFADIFRWIVVDPRPKSSRSPFDHLYDPFAHLGRG